MNKNIPNLNGCGYLILFFIFLLTSCSKDPTEQPLPQEVMQSLESKLVEQRDLLRFPGAVVGIWVEGVGKWESPIGLAQKDTTKAVSLNHHFRIGSITKTFTNTALLILVDKKKLSLDDAISKYIGGVPNGDKITLRHLANMTSGLPNYSESENFDETLWNEPEKIWKTKELLQLAFNQPLSFEPGESWEYSNTNTVLLGLVIEKVSGKDLATFLKENIFKPLSLDNTSYPSDKSMPSPYSHGYTMQSKDGKVADATFRDPSWTNAAGEMISKLSDLRLWGKALGTGKLIQPETFAQQTTFVNSKMVKDVEIGYGLGMFKINSWIGHNGELPGYNAFVAYHPEKKIIFACMVNADSALVSDMLDKHPANELFKELSLVIEEAIEKDPTTTEN